MPLPAKKARSKGQKLQGRQGGTRSWQSTLCAVGKTSRTQAAQNLKLSAAVSQARAGRGAGATGSTKSTLQLPLCPRLGACFDA